MQSPTLALPVAGLGPIRVHLRLANGQCSVKGCNEGKWMSVWHSAAVFVDGCHTNWSLLSQWMWPIPRTTRRLTILWPKY